MKMNEPIAVVGSACRFAGGATSPSKLWNLLRNPQDVRSRIPDERFNADGFYHPNSAYHGHSNVRHAYLLDQDIGRFDAEFFGINPIEAKAIDPQQRLLMETVFEGVEAAGMTIRNLRGSDTSVFVGVMCDDYAALQVRDLQLAPTYFATGTAQSILSNRVSYFFDWHGPSVTLDTACSSSLVAVHMAVQALRTGESHVSLACGSNLILGPENFIFESKLKMLSPDGRSKMWDHAANGYARGDGVAAVVLKTLSAALADGDHIECLIRETGVNQDGATGGITMPSAVAQRALIRQTYAKAGLDPQNSSHRPQYFEAHGTGTPAGDPIEAEAISKAFFGEDLEHPRESSQDPLYVGSIKTILGHTEGTAGVAALLKASLALQDGLIPPNLLLEKLSDRVQPFYENLKIATSARPWPQLPADLPRRASVNSFGFGGTNAHAILETYTPQTAAVAPFAPTSHTILTPFVFSATSRKSLAANLSAYAAFLEQHSDTELRDLAWTLRQRRSAFTYRIAFSARSVEELKSQVQAELENDSNELGTRVLSTSKSRKPRILGIFTGQGTQYVRMGAELVEKSPTARRIIQKLEAYLSEIQGQDRVRWSLQAELLADASTTRLSEAAISQPLCTALQILLVDMLGLADVELTAVVGHSSGEIAAAYAAGYLSARDAMLIAYYRGLHAQLAKSPNGQDIKGKMLAVGTDMDNAAELCADAEFAGRVGVAASNSSSSVTLSGDEDAIAEVQLVLDDEKLFNRRLRVDKAYHSNHMLPCFDPYVESLRQAGVQAKNPVGTRPIWISSVSEEKVDLELKLSDRYWAENMTKPVLFSQALNTALALTDYDIAVEIGPHPALQGPASQTIQEALEHVIPYQGLLSRGVNAAQASSSALGFLWSHLDETAICLDNYERAMSGDKRPYRVVKGLPSYQWNHEARHWHESRVSRRTRMRSQPVHPLLGHPTPDSSAHHMSWKHLLRASEIDWLSGHRIQGQIVFPAAGYICAALEAALIAADGIKGVSLVKLDNFTIHQAVAFDEDDSSVETLVSLGNIVHQRKDCIRANFTFSAALTADADDLTLAASGELIITLGHSECAGLPSRQPKAPDMIGVNTDRFYEFVASLGYNFEGPFRALSSINKKYSRSSCVLRTKEASTAEDTSPTLLLQPAELDASFQAIILAFSFPDDDQLVTMHLPTSIETIRIDPAVCKRPTSHLGAESVVTTRLGRGMGILGDVNLYTENCPSAMVQMQGVKLVPLSKTAVGEYRRVFSTTHWVNSVPDGIEPAEDILPAGVDDELLTALERTSLFYLRNLAQMILEDSFLNDQRFLSHYLHFARHVVFEAKAGRLDRAQPVWLQDTAADIKELIALFAHDPTIEAIHHIGQQLPRVLRGETTMDEQFGADGVLSDYLMNGFGFREARDWLSSAAQQVTDRHLHLKILELSAENNSDERNKERQPLVTDYLTYTIAHTCHEIEEAVDEQGNIYHKSLNLDRDPIEQGYKEATYDLILAPFTLHATEQLNRTLGHVRKLLRPGGYLVAAEGRGGGINTLHGLLCGISPGWWRGVDEGRKLSPLIAADEWNRLLQATGFSGLDTTAPREFEDGLRITTFVSQAVNGRIKLLREPLAASSPSPLINKLFIVGGKTQPVASLVSNLRALNFAEQTHVCETLLDIDYSMLDPDSAVISLTELDEPIFKTLDAEKFESLKLMFSQEKTLLWVTSGRLEREPFSNMTVGFGRTAVHEVLTLRLQYLDVADPREVDARVLAEVLLRLHVANSSAESAHTTKALWVNEAEIVLDSSGRQLVPRLRPVKYRNDRYNSARRPVPHQVSPMFSNIRLHYDDESCDAEELPSLGTVIRQKQGIIRLRTVRSIWSAVRTPLGPKFLILGVDVNGANHLALVPSSTSHVDLNEDSIVPCTIPAGSSFDSMLNHAAAYVLATAILMPMFAGQTVLVHNASATLASALSAQAAAKGIMVMMTADIGDDLETLSSNWIQIPRCMSQTEAKRLTRSANITAFVGFSNHEHEAAENEATLLSSLPPHCHKHTASTLYFTDGCEDGSSSAGVLGHMLREAASYAAKAQDEPGSLVEAIGLKDLTDGTKWPTCPTAVVDWESSTDITAYATRLDSMPLFREDKTYWMVGLTGALGISLCDWMIARGARSLVLSSRSPKVSQDWVTSHQANGVRVTVLPCDITDESNLKLAHKLICATLPPIAGVLNGAIVLRDVSISNMSFEQMVEVLRPKVDGTINLDRLFFNDPLDFFILFSSTSCVAGNPGQANYSAANAFLCGIAAQRRARGLAATALNCGAIIGAGYMARESSKALDLTVSKMAMMHLSEEDYHQLFVEAIDAGRVDSGEPAELTTGFLDIQANSANNPRWQSNPTFESFVIHQSGVQDSGDGKATGLSIQSRLQACKSRQDVLEVVKDTFAAQLRYELQMTTPDEDLMAMRGNEMGLDSLISVDIRSWLLKNFGVSVPVLKIMGNDTMGYIAEQTAEGVLSELMPQVDLGDGGKSVVQEKAAA